MSTILYWVLSIFLFGIMIIVHELGHFWAARLTGIGVLEFAVGIGPKLWSRTSASGIMYSLRAFPFGGYCKFIAEEEGEPSDRPDAYYQQAIWKRVLVSVGGPLMNFLVAFIVIFILLTTNAFEQAMPIVDSVIPNMPAQAAGMIPGDKIVGVNGEQTENVEDISSAIAKGNEAITFDIERDGQPITLTITPQWVESDQGWKIGIYYRQGTFRYGIFPALWQSVKTTGRMSRLLLDAFMDIIREKDVSNLSGPLGAVVAVKEQTQTYGIFGYLNYAAFLSINLAIFNLFPIPGLDGSKLVFLLIEKIRGKRLNPNKEGFVILIGFGLLLIVTVLVLYQDIMRLIS